MPRTITINESFEAVGEHSSVSSVAEPITHTFDEQKLGEGPARAIARAVADGIKGIAETAAPATIARRKAARAGLAKGDPLAVERYGGKPPTGSVRLFNDSGRLLELAVQFAGGDWQIATGRELGGNTFDAGEAATMIERLRRLVPALADPLGPSPVSAAIAETPSQIIEVGTARR